MTNEQKQVADWMKAFGQEVKEKPEIPSLEVRKLRAKLILEEALETIEALGFSFCIIDGYSGEVFVHSKGNTQIQVLEHGICKAPNLTGILDGCEDLKVVVEGTLAACGLLEKEPRCELLDCEGKTWKYHFEDPHFNEVMRSNWTKLWSRDELQIELNGEIGSFILGETKTFNDLKVTFIKKHRDGSLFDDKVFLVKNKDGKVIKSPSYSPPSFTI